MSMSCACVKALENKKSPQNNHEQRRLVTRCSPFLSVRGLCWFVIESGLPEWLRRVLIKSGDFCKTEVLGKHPSNN
jgi:hypothetical protein